MCVPGKRVGLLSAVLTLCFLASPHAVILAQESKDAASEPVPGEELPDLEARLRAVQGMEKQAGEDQLSLHQLVQQRKYAAVIGRIRAGADLNALDDQGQAPLHIAIAGHQLTMSLILVNNGADIHKENQQNQTPLDLVKQEYDQQSAEEMTSMLEKRYALVKAGKHKVPRPERNRSISVWLEPLKVHHAQLKKIDERFRILGAMQTPPPKKDVKQQGELLVAAAQAACAYLDKYSNTNRGPRRGLFEERELVREMRAMLERSTIILQQLSQLQMPQDKDAGYAARSRSVAHEAVLFYLKQEVEEKLDQEGLGAFIKPEHLQMFRDRSTQQIEKSMKGYLDQQLQQVIGIRLNDMKSLQAAARAKVRNEIKAQVAKLVMNISSYHLVIRFAQDVVLELLEEKLWPKIREELRPKGNLEARTRASVATLEKSYEELSELSSQDPSALDLREASKVLRRAEGRQKAMKYLLKDAKKAKRQDLLDELAVSQNMLIQRYNMVSYQFMLREENQVAKQVKDENTIMKGLLEVARYLVGHISDSNLVLLGVDSPQTRSSFAIYPTVMEFDRKGYQRKQLSRPDIVVKKKRFYKVWEKEYVVRSRLKGRTLYSYRFWRPSRGGDMMSRIGNDSWLCGMAPGTHVVQARVVTLDGEIYDFEYEIEVRPLSQRDQDSINYAYRGVKRERANFTRADSTEKKARGAGDYSGALTAFMSTLMSYGGEKSCDVQRFLDECNAVASFMLKGEPDEGRTLEVQYIKTMAAMCQICSEQGTPESFEKAKQYTAQAEKVQARPGLRKTRYMADCYDALKDMSVTIFNDVAEGRKYHEKDIQARLKSGLKLLDIDWLRSEFPKQIKVPEKTKEVTSKE
ncbi:hypothetical protein Pan241w_33250 [Gimesia alba]|uniref:Uncharacterized protein n=1 Tax=Gimesia alba TaxID=2527973 RepID=A0A517RH87_9PLAN|nr:ankyrin repeat domain-containing protein [Gimesia alba]QDT43225.1 hypothetical protein Pan241w_33250 [Gimesia alba]